MRLARLVALLGFVVMTIGCQSKELTREAAARLIEESFEPKTGWEISEPIYQEGKKQGLWSDNCVSLGPVPTATPDPETKDNPLANVGKPPKHDWALLRPGTGADGCSLDGQGGLRCKGTPIKTNNWPIPRGYLSDWSPSGRYRVLMVCDEDNDHASCVWSMMIDMRKAALSRASCDELRPVEWVAWSPGEKHAVTLQAGEGWANLCVHALASGRSGPAKMGPVGGGVSELVGADVELPTFRWAEDGGSFSFVAQRFAVKEKFPPYDEMTEAQRQAYFEAVDKAWGAGDRIGLDVFVDGWEAVCRSVQPDDAILKQQVAKVDLYPSAFRTSGSAVGDLLRTLSVAEGRAIAKLSFLEPARLGVEVTGITSPTDTIKEAEFSWRLPTLEGPLGDLISRVVGGRADTAPIQTGRAKFQLYDDGWRVVDVSGMRIVADGSILKFQ